MRQLISQSMPGRNGLLELTGKDYRYLRRVLRVKAGDMIEVRTPDGVLHPMTVCSADDAGGTVVLQICALPGTPEEGGITRGVCASRIDAAGRPVEYTLFQFIAKPQKMELIIRQAVECGVRTVVPVEGVYSQKGSIEAFRGRAVKSERMERIIREAREQSGSPVETEVHEPLSVSDAVRFWQESCGGLMPEKCAAIVLSERNESCRRLASVAGGAVSIRRAAVAVGSEGGISPEEIGILAEGGFVPVHFACNILRCETAALYGMAALQSALADAVAAAGE